jgi:hypothetical protein
VSKYTIRPGLYNAASFETSAIPFVTSSLAVPVLTDEPLVVELDFVSKDFTVKNDGPTTIRVGFSRNGIKAAENNNYFTLATGETFNAEYRIVDIFLISNSPTQTSTATVIAGLTPVERLQLPNNWSGSLYKAGIG